MGRGERRRQETRAKLIHAAHELMGRNGIDATTIQEITDSADVGFGSFYNHFESKTAIVQAIMDETVESYGDVLDHIADAVQDPAEILAASVRYVVMRGCEAPAWGWFLIRASLTMEALRVGLGRRMARDIRAGVESGRFRAGDVTHITLTEHQDGVTLYRCDLTRASTSDLQAVMGRFAGAATLVQDAVR